MLRTGQILTVLAKHRSAYSLRYSKNKIPVCSLPPFNGHFRHNTSIAPKQNDSESEWTRIYRFRWIVGAFVLNRLKLYQTVVAVVGIPVSIQFYQQGLMPLQAAQFLVGSGILACFVLYAYSYYTRRLVGLMYKNRKSDLLKIYHLSFWGQKKEVIIEAEDIIPFTELDGSPKDAYLKLERYSTKEFLIIPMFKIDIPNVQDFEEIFGSLDGKFYKTK